MKLFERLLSKNLELMQENLDGTHFVEYKSNLIETFKILLWVVMASLVVLIIMQLGINATRGYAKLVALSIVILPVVISMLQSYKKIYPYICQVDEVRSRWNAAICVTALLGVITTCLGVYDIIKLFDSQLNDSEQVYSCQDVNMTVTVPPGFTDIEYDNEVSPNDVCWYVTNNENTIVVQVCPDWYSADLYLDAEGNVCDIIYAHYDKFVIDDKIYYKGGMQTKPQVIEIDNCPVYVSYGKHVTDKNVSHITYRLLRNKALIIVTYIYDDKLDRSEQERKAYEFVSDMKFNL